MSFTWERFLWRLILSLNSQSEFPQLTTTLQICLGCLWICCPPPVSGTSMIEALTGVEGLLECVDLLSCLSGCCSEFCHALAVTLGSSSRKWGMGGCWETFVFTFQSPVGVFHCCFQSAWLPGFSVPVRTVLHHFTHFCHPMHFVQAMTCCGVYVELALQISQI